MNQKKRNGISVGLVLAVSLLAAALTAFFFAERQERAQFMLLETICGQIAEEDIAAEEKILRVIKESRKNLQTGRGEGFLSKYGYQPEDFTGAEKRTAVIFGMASAATGLCLFWALYKASEYRQRMRIQELTQYLEQINTGAAELFPQRTEDLFSGLQDEIYKTVTMLQQMKDAAVQERNLFAENLANIAHQLKTPITAVSLLIQTMRECEVQCREQKSDAAACQEKTLERNRKKGYLDQMQKQLERLTCMEEALLVLSRIDAGTLPLKRQQVDVFTLLTMAEENLQEISEAAEVSVVISETGEALVQADPEWTMQAVMNLMKNCMEHTPKGKCVFCSYDQNPMYTRICIWDEGNGFVREDLPHLFERFYRGKDAVKTGGIGIGLALAKEILEMQNGMVSASNLPKGGACFEIRIYCH